MKQTTDKLRAFRPFCKVLLLVTFFILVTGIDSARSSNTIQVSQGTAFTIILKSNPSTGYQWSAKFDHGILRLKEKTFRRPSGSLLGAPGEQIFIFIARKVGITNIEMTYCRPWEKNFAEQRVYEVRITE